jgi:hypothetical protein
MPHPDEPRTLATHFFASLPGHHPPRYGGIKVQAAAILEAFSSKVEIGFRQENVSNQDYRSRLAA